MTSNSSNMISDIAKSSLLDDLKKNGIVVCHQWLPEIKSVMPEFQKELDSAPDNYPPGKMARVPAQNFKDIPTIVSMFRKSELTTLAEQYLGKPIDHLLQIFMSHEWRILDKEKWSRNQHIHFDPYRALKFMVYLTDVTKDNGAFCCAPGTHAIGAELRQRNSLEKNLHSNTYTLEAHPDYADLAKEVRPIEGQAGTLLVFDTDIIHGGGVIKEGERKVIIAHNRKR